MQDICKFLSQKGTPICREERQYALFLYNIFLQKKKHDKCPEAVEISETVNEIIKSCLGEEPNSIRIEHVFYEATLMRDYHHYSENKKGFLNDLLNFCFVEKGDEIDHLIKAISNKLKGDNPGAKNGSLDTFLKTIHSPLSNISYDFVKMMMNATPDIMVIYRAGNALLAKGIECKYLSQEGRYEDAIKGSRIKMQYFVQECVMAFLFGDWSESFSDHKILKPTKGNWVTEKPGQPNWESTYDRYCKDIFAKKPKGIVGNGDEKILNKGITVVRFTDQKSNKNQISEKGEVLVDIKGLLAEEYNFFI